MTPASLLADTLQAAIDRYLRLADEPAKTLSKLSGHHVQLVLMLAPDTPARFDIRGEPDRLRVSVGTAADTGEPDARISGSPGALMHMAVAGHATEGVVIDGDARLAQALLKLFTDHAPDAEELLSRVTGDIAARQFGNAVRGLKAFHRQTLDHLMGNTREYLQYETQDLAPRVEVDAFLAEVDVLRDDVDRLDARVKRLAAGRSGPSDTPC